MPLNWYPHSGYELEYRSQHHTSLLSRTKETKVKMMLKSYLTGPDQVSCDWWRAGHVTWILTSDWPMTGPRRAGAGDGAGGAPGVRLRLSPARPQGVPRPLQHHHLRVRLQRPAVRTGGGIKYFLDQIFFANTARVTWSGYAASSPRH